MTIQAPVKVSGWTGYDETTLANSGEGVFPVGAYPSSERFLYAGNVYQLMRCLVWVSAFPNNTTENIAHGITDFPTDSHIPVFISGWTTGTTRTPINPSTIEYSCDATNLILTTTTNESAVSGYVLIEYYAPATSTPLVDF